MINYALNEFITIWVELIKRNYIGLRTMVYITVVNYVSKLPILPFRRAHDPVLVLLAL